MTFRGFVLVPIKADEIEVSKGAATGSRLELSLDRTHVRSCTLNGRRQKTPPIRSPWFIRPPPTRASDYWYLMQIRLNGSTGGWCVQPRPLLVELGWTEFLAAALVY